MFAAEQVEQLIEVAHRYLKRQRQAVSERQLLIELARHNVWVDLGRSSAILQQFQKHFLTMHALYRLQRKLAGSNIYLQISPVAIQLQDSSDPDAGTASGPDAQLRDYFLNLKQFWDDDEKSVADLLTGFQQRYEAWLLHREAYRALDLNADANWMEVQAAYRRKAVLCHPDKGGDAQDFQKVVEAYKNLKRILRP